MEGSVLADCCVSLGMFSCERLVEMRLADGSRDFFFVDKGYKKSTQVQPAGQASGVPGHVKVLIIKEYENSYLVELPQTGFRHGTRVKIPKHAIQ